MNITYAPIQSFPVPDTHLLKNIHQTNLTFPLVLNQSDINVVTEPLKYSAQISKLLIAIPYIILL